MSRRYERDNERYCDMLIIQEQQRLLDEVAREIGAVTYRPDYHGKTGDPNTVLFYTREDEERNRELERSGEMITRSQFEDMKWRRMDTSGLKDKVERPYFFVFQNDDINGQYDVRYANYGRFDLYKLGGMDDLLNAIREAYQEYIEKKR